MTLPASQIDVRARAGLGAQAGRGQAYREALAYITRAALMGGATGVSPGSGTVSQKWGICLTQVIALASAGWGGPPGPRRPPRPPAGRPARGPPAGEGARPTSLHRTRAT